MRLKKGTFSDFAQRVKGTGKKVIVYGAGVIGQTVAPYWLREFGLENDVLCYVDADPNKQGKTAPLGEREVSIAFEPVAAALEKISALDAAECYFLPVMLVERAHSLKSEGVVKTSEKQLIPKTIHYCWFSGNPIPDTLKRCMGTWEKFCPDYEIVRWDESNYDISWSPYMVQAYERKKWGFVSDVARLDILYRYGGIYLDTDVELLKSLDELLYQPAFCGIEKWCVVNSGGCSGTQPGNSLIKAMLDFRQDIFLECEDGSLNFLSSGYYETMSLLKAGLRADGLTQHVNNQIIIYSSDFFHPFDYMSGETQITENTFSIHHFSGSWLGENAALERQHTRNRYQNFLNRLEE